MNKTSKKREEVVLKLKYCRHGHIYCTCEPRFNKSYLKHLNIGLNGYFRIKNDKNKQNS